MQQCQEEAMLLANLKHQSEGVIALIAGKTDSWWWDVAYFEDNSENQLFLLSQHPPPYLLMILVEVAKGIGRSLLLWQLHLNIALSSSPQR